MLKSILKQNLNLVVEELPKLHDHLAHNNVSISQMVMQARQFPSIVECWSSHGSSAWPSYSLSWHWVLVLLLPDYSDGVSVIWEEESLEGSCGHSQCIHGICMLEDHKAGRHKLSFLHGTPWLARLIYFCWYIRFWWWSCIFFSPPQARSWFRLLTFCAW